jgi:tetratricopeptide (TPR) repeat protein
VHAGDYGLMAASGPERAARAAGNAARAVAWPVRSGLVPSLAEGFVIRPETVPGLEVALVPGAAVALVPGRAAAQDRGGWPWPRGKTQLASYVAESLWRSRAVDMLAWVTATSRAAVLSGYVQAAAKLGLDYGGDAESIAARFTAWLGGTSRSWLVVFDDLCDAADLEGLWPAGPSGRLLITTADPATVGGESRVTALAVPAFSTREAMACLSDRLTRDPDQRSGAIDLVADLGCEPELLAQAAAVIASSGMSCREYQRWFVQQRTQFPDGGGGVSSASFATWALSAGHAEKLSAGGGTWLVLVLAGLLDGHGIPGTVFAAPAACQYLTEQGAVPRPDAAGAWPVLTALERGGLLVIHRVGEPPAVCMSRAVQAVVLAAAPRGVLDRAVHAAADALTEAWPQDQPRSWPATALRSCAASLWRLAGDELWAGGGCHPVLLKAGQSLDAAGMAGPAVTWWRELAADCGRILGPGHPDTLAAGGLLAEALLAAGQAAEAVPWREWVLAGRIGAFGPDHPGTITAQAGLGRALVAAGKSGAAVAVLEDALSRSERVRGPHEIGTMAVRNEYAAACLAAGKAAEAIRCHERIQADRERLQGPGHPGTQAASLRLAGAYLAAGRAKKAIALYQRVLADQEHSLGADHLGTLAVRASLAAAYDATGRMSTALEHHQQACAGYERVLGPGHPDTLARRADLARAYYAAGQLGDAVALFRDTIARSEQALSPGDPLTVALREAAADITGEMAAE